MDYTRYKLPIGPPKHFGKAYLVDNRRNPQSPEAIRVKAFTGALVDLGLKVAHDEHQGVTGMRWAAMSAGLGQIRRNNFFYGQNGSFMAITAWLIDRELEWLSEAPQKPCAEGC